MYLTDCKTFVEIRFFSRLTIEELASRISAVTGFEKRSFLVFYSPGPAGKIVVIFKADFSPERLAKKISQLEPFLQS